MAPPDASMVSCYGVVAFMVRLLLGMGVCEREVVVCGAGAVAEACLAGKKAR